MQINRENPNTNTNTNTNNRENPNTNKMQIQIIEKNPNKKQMLDFQHFFIVHVENYAYIFCNNHHLQLCEMFEHTFW